MSLSKRRPNRRMVKSKREYPLARTLPSSSVSKRNVPRARSNNFSRVWTSWTRPSSNASKMTGMRSGHLVAKTARSKGALAKTVSPSKAVSTKSLAAGSVWWTTPDSPRPKTVPAQDTHTNGGARLPAKINMVSVSRAVSITRAPKCGW